MTQATPELLPAVGRVCLGPVDQGLLGGGGGRDVIGAHAGEEARLAVQGGNRRADAPGVEADDVVVGRDARAQALGRGGILGDHPEGLGEGNHRIGVAAGL